MDAAQDTVLIGFRVEPRTNFRVTARAGVRPGDHISFASYRQNSSGLSIYACCRVRSVPPPHSWPGGAGKETEVVLASSKISSRAPCP